MIRTRTRAGLLAAALAAALTTGCAPGSAAGPAAPPSSPPPAPFDTALSNCHTSSGRNGVEVTDAGRTLLLNGTGKEDFAGTDITTIACVLGELETPQATISHMDATRALDGRQQAQWNGFTASWTYHPDQGLDLILQAP